MLEINNIINQKTLNVNSIFEHPILNCEAKYCYQVVAKVQGEWSVNPTVPYSTISKSEIKCIDRKTILAPPLSEGRVGVIDADVIELEFQDNSSWPVNKDQYFLYKYILGVNTKIDSIVASQSKKFSLKENTNAKSLCYKVGYKAMCGSESALSEPMSTIYLQASEDDELDWTTNAPFGNSTIQSIELISIDENTSTEFIEKILNQNIKNTSVNISVEDIEVKYKIRALGKGNINSLSNQISIPIEALFLVPDVFTPNSDNMNKLLEIKGKFGRVNNHKLTIFNRWGNGMKEITDENGNGDKQHNETPLPSATYFYKLSIGLTGNESFMKQGKFEFLR
jgi:gliding motility-associated-like protein